MALRGLADANGDGLQEAFVSLSRGAANDFMGVFALTGSELIQVEEAGEGPLLIDVGGPADFGSGGACKDVDGDGNPELVLFEVHSAQGSRHAWKKDIYEWEGFRVLFREKVTGSFEYRGRKDDRRVGGFHEFRCGGFVTY